MALQTPLSRGHGYAGDDLTTVSQPELKSQDIIYTGYNHAPGHDLIDSKS